MQKCEHGKTITKFCMFEHCQSKQPGGCEDCIKKYHNHIGQISFLTEDDIKNIIKKFQIEANYRPKSRTLQQCIFNFFTHIKTNISTNLDVACKNLINEIGYPYLQKNGTLNCYKRLKNKQYRKVSQKELKQLWEVYKTTDFNEVMREEKKIYAEAVCKMEETLQKMQKSIKDIFQNLTSIISLPKSNAALYDRTFYIKTNDILKEIQKYSDFVTLKVSEPREIKKQIVKNQSSPNDRKKPSRDVSLDRQVKMENNLKNTVKPKLQEQIVETQKSREGKGDKLQRNDRKQEQKSATQRRVGKKKSIELRPQQLNIRPEFKKNLSLDQFSQKQEQIVERKKKLMQLMSLKPPKRQDTGKNRKQSISIADERQKSSSKRPQLSDYLKDSLSPNRWAGKNLTVGQNTIKQSGDQYLLTPNCNSGHGQYFSSAKRAKTSYYQEQQQHTDSKKQTRNQTVMSSLSETEQLVHADVCIPIEDGKQQDQFEINEESVQKCIVITEVDAMAKNILSMHTPLPNETPLECQSPLLIKKKEIQNFCAMMKLAESKIIEDKQDEAQVQSSPQNQNGKKDGPPDVKEGGQIGKQCTKTDEKQVDKSDGNSFMKMTKVENQAPSNLMALLFSPTPSVQNSTQSPNSPITSKSRLNRTSSVQINDNQQHSLQLLLRSLKLTGPQAIPYLQKSLQYSTNNLSAAQYLSYLYLQVEKPQDCLKICNEFLKVISSSETNELALRLNINKSAALNQLGRYSECITFLQRCLRSRHNDQLYKNLADAYYSIGILQKAIYNYEHAIIENSSNTEAHYNLAVCHYQQENYYNASIYIEKALKHQPTNPIYIEMKKYTDQKIEANQIK